MTKEILISGDLRQICFDTPSRNLNMVEVLNEVLRMNVYPTLYFDVIPFREDDDLSALLAFYMEKSPMYFDNRCIWSNLADIITGESKNIELPSPSLRTLPMIVCWRLGFSVECGVRTLTHWVGITFLCQISNILLTACTYW